MGMAPGAVLPFHLEAPLQRNLSYGILSIPHEVSVKNLNQILLSKTNHTGSDVRISTVQENFLILRVLRVKVLRLRGGIGNLRLE